MHAPVISRSVFAAALVLAAAVTAAGQTVRLEFHDGQVTSRRRTRRCARSSTSGRASAARASSTASASRGAPVTLELTGVPERQALDILLRDVSGYMLAPRQRNSCPASPRSIAS